MAKYYFLSDAHIGTEIVGNKQLHEKYLVAWLDSIKYDASAIFLVGDIFDFWFEYKSCVPKGFVRLLGKLAELTDSGIEVHFFIGNHDLWTFGYLAQEIGLTVHQTPQIIELLGKRFFIAHGDGLKDIGVGLRLLRRIFHSPLLQKCFGLLHPDIGISFGNWWSNRNRQKHGYFPYQGEQNEPLVSFAKNFEPNKVFDYFIFGHRHILLNLQATPQRQVVILGDFYAEFSYAVFDDNGIALEHFSIANQ